ncbi:MAG: hypothetical protein QOG54_1405 [Actinomycetota bacterium]|nr:hypothetical protein [Actinomycetota bacterium]
MKLPREPFAWDGQDDQPVPLVEGEPLDPAAQAESYVRAAQAAIAEEKTDPFLNLGDLLATSAKSPALGSAPRTHFRRRVGALLLGCAVAFAHGWHAGATSGSRTRASSMSCRCEHEADS